MQNKRHSFEFIISLIYEPLKIFFILTKTFKRLMEELGESDTKNWKRVKIWNYEIVQRYADDNFYAFTRGNVLACFSNTYSLSRTITYHEFSEGTKLCNVLYDGDCVTVSGGSINIEMGDYPKVYVKQ